MKLVRTFVSLAVILTQVLVYAPTAHAVSGKKTMLMVSAYYSPLPGQRFYMRGSYQGDIRLNGRGTNGADGTEVYIGMLAAPRTFAFGTRVRIPGLGVGDVHDRGGAIRAYNSYDRIDVWMGHGEEGLSRALNWGMRLVEGEVFTKAYQVEPGLSFSHISSQLPKSTLNRLIGKTRVNPTTFSKPITKASSATTIIELQEALRMFGYYRGPITGKIGKSTESAILSFQLAEGVIVNRNVKGAGYFGPKTRQALKTKLENFNSKVQMEQNRLKDNLKSLTVGMGKNARGDKVYRMQQMLWELGFYKGELNGTYDRNTIDAVYRFQKANGVINSNWDKGAGYFGKKTHEALAAAVDQKVEKLAKYPVAMQVWVPAKIDLPKLNTFNASIKVPVHKPLNFDADMTKAAPVAKGVFHRKMNLKDSGKDVRTLQNVLSEHGYLPAGLNTGYFGEQTRQALVKFQKNKGIIKTASSPGAGSVGPKTLTVLNSL